MLFAASERNRDGLQKRAMNLKIQFAAVIRLLCKLAPPIGIRLKNRFNASFAGIQATAKYRECLYEVDLGDSIGSSLFFYRSYEPVFERRLFDSLKDARFFMDIGANIGIYAVAAAKRVRHVYAFEPSPTVRECLNRNVRLNKLTNVTVVDRAVSDVVGNTYFYENLRPSNRGVGKIFRAGYDREEELKIDVQTTTLDYFIPAKLRGTRGAIKIDVEGAELKVLEGGRNFLSQKHAPILLIEVHPGEMKILGSSPEDLFKCLRTYGYTVRDVVNLSEIHPESLSTEHAAFFSVVCTK